MPVDRRPERRCASPGRSPCRPAPTTSIVVVKEPTPEKAPKNAPPPKISVIKQTVEVPDFWNGELDDQLGDRRRSGSIRCRRR